MTATTTEPEAALRRLLEDVTAERDGLNRQVRILRARNARLHRAVNDVLAVVRRRPSSEHASIDAFTEVRQALTRAVTL